MTVAVTGDDSFIGSHLVEILSELGARVTVVDDLSGKMVNWDRREIVYASST